MHNYITDYRVVNTAIIAAILLGRTAVLRCGLLLQRGPSVGLSVTIVTPAETAEPIEMPFTAWTPVGPRNHVLDRGAHWRHLANLS